MKLFQSKITCMKDKQIVTGTVEGFPSLEYPNGGGYCYHDFIEIELFCKGSGIHYLNTIPYKVQHGYFYLLMPGDYHYYSLDESEPFIMHNIKISTAVPSPAILEKLASFPKPYAVYLEEQAFDTVLREVDLLHQTNRAFGDDNLMTRNIAERIILLLIQHLQNGIRPAAEDIPTTLRSIVDYVDHHYAEQITLENMAALTQLTPRYFSSYFKAKTNITFCDYVNQVRLIHAIKLMETTALSIKEIACAVGFKSNTYFTRIFTRSFGITPSDYCSR